MKFEPRALQPQPRVTSIPKPLNLMWSWSRLFWCEPEKTGSSGSILIDSRHLFCSSTLKVMQMSYRRVDVKPNCFPKDVLQTWKVCISLNCPQLFHYNTCIAWCTYYGDLQWLTLLTFDWMRQQCHSCSMLNGTLVWPFALTTSLFVYLYIISTLFLLCFIYHRLLSSFVYLPSISNCVYLTFTTTTLIEIDKCWT